MLSFSEWNRINYSIDESIGEDLHNWLSRNFGGKISKLDGIISDLVSLEKDYASEWEKKQREISSMESQIETGEISSEEEKSFRKKIKEKKEEIEIADRKRVQKNRFLNDKARKIVEGNPRIHKYWDLKKSEAELSVIENLYNISKTLPSRKTEDRFYKDYVSAQEKLSRKRRGIEDLQKDIVEEKPKEEEREDTKEIPSVRSLISMSTSDFRSQIKNYSTPEIRKIKKILVDRKNLALNELRSLRRSKDKELDKISSQKDRKDVISKYNPRIYEMGEFIDRMREKISYLDV